MARVGLHVPASIGGNPLGTFGEERAGGDLQLAGGRTLGERWSEDMFRHQAVARTAGKATTQMEMNHIAPGWNEIELAIVGFDEGGNHSPQ